MTLLVLTDDAARLAHALMVGGAVPENAETDAMHIAVAAVNHIDYILTWNFTHIANTVTIPAIGEICERRGYNTPIITTPNQLKGGIDIGR